MILQNGGLPATPPVPAITPPAAGGADRFGPAPTYPAAPAAAVQVAPVWRLYRIRRRSDGRGYVGVTKRLLAVRQTAHVYTARRCPHLGGAGSLAEAIRQATAAGLSFEAAFEIELLAETALAEDARRLERDLIAHFRTARPAGST